MMWKEQKQNQPTRIFQHTERDEKNEENRRAKTHSLWMHIRHFHNMTTCKCFVSKRERVKKNCIQCGWVHNTECVCVQEKIKELLKYDTKIRKQKSNRQMWPSESIYWGCTMDLHKDSNSINKIQPMLKNNSRHIFNGSHSWGH